MPNKRKGLIASLIIFVALIVAISVFMTLRFRQARLEVSQWMDRIDQIDFSELEEEAPIDVIVSLGVLETELQGIWFLRISDKEQALELLQVFEGFIKDNKLAPLEYEEWMKQFERESVWLGKEEPL
ncbi:MAG: hypothetical protein HY538_04055 [Deltaproteobacteria bacterium]|nr:hypothetical protein [Deltaproteobacteria bacterium]